MSIIDLKEQNWKNLTTNHLNNWHGIWTMYSPNKEVTESFQSLRSFRANPEQTEIFHTNRYIYSEEKIIEDSWQFNKLQNNLSDGLFHPAIQSRRGFFFEDGHAAWVTTNLKTGSDFGVELFFKYQDLRHSVGVAYDQHGNLLRIANIREDRTGFPSQYWSTQLNQLHERNLSDNWLGTAVTITPDLKTSVHVPTQLHYSWEEHKNFFLPDGVSVSCPGKVNIGNRFTIAANWLVTPTMLQQLLVKYNEDGAFAMLTLELGEKPDS